VCVCVCVFVCVFVCVCVRVCVVCVCVYIITTHYWSSVSLNDTLLSYGVALISRIDKIIGRFCKRALLKRQYSAKETYNLIDPTNRSHPIRHTTGWRRPIGCLNLQVIFRKRATNYMVFLKKMTYEDKASYDPTPLCTTLSSQRVIMSNNIQEWLKNNHLTLW